MNHAKITAHHVPPRSRRQNPHHGFIIRVQWFKHRAYHELFGCPASYAEAKAILAKRWNNPSLARQQQILFGKASLQTALQLLLTHWWTPKRKHTLAKLAA